MAKVDGDPQTPDAVAARKASATSDDLAAPGRGGAPSKRDSGAHHLTGKDDVPSLHVLEAAQIHDRKEAETLLAGFARPAARPVFRLNTTASPKRDFIDYYADTSGTPAPARVRVSGLVPAAPAGVATGAAAPTSAMRSAAEETTAVRARFRKRPARLWLLATALTLMAGVSIAYCAIRQGVAEPRARPTEAVDAEPLVNLAHSELSLPSRPAFPPSAASSAPVAPPESAPPASASASHKVPRTSPASSGRHVPPRGDFIRTP